MYEESFSRSRPEVTEYHMDTGGSILLSSRSAVATAIRGSCYHAVQTKGEPTVSVELFVGVRCDDYLTLKEKHRYLHFAISNKIPYYIYYE